MLQRTWASVLDGPQADTQVSCWWVLRTLRAQFLHTGFFRRRRPEDTHNKHKAEQYIWSSRIWRPAIFRANEEEEEEEESRGQMFTISMRV
ncbi:hypothetical protein EYF80_001969 [Liparis tanakae]|uniref:Uncharacterized protein n=1 Tax=Liparis tanakae TaxID=230148 RepID=A0A4Z2JEF2_9TELE|nr:hypothetical protein EYF80_001969 [Liparis tanakae]